MLVYAEAAGAKLLPPTSEMEPGSQLVVFDVVLFVGGRETPDADARRPPRYYLPCAFAMASRM